MNRKLRMLLLAAALLGLPFFGTRADVVDWMPVGEEVVDAGELIPDPNTGDSSEYWIPLTGGAYEDGDRIWDKEQGYNDWNLSFKAIGACPAEENVLNVYGTLHDDTGTEILDEEGYPVQCSLKIDGDVKIEAIDADATVNFVASETAIDLGSGGTVPVVPTIIEPYIYDYTSQYQGTEGYYYSMVIFDVAVGRNLTVNVQTDVTFRGRQVGKTPDEFINSDGYIRGKRDIGDIYDMILVFRGAGQTKFILSDGTIVSFTGDKDTSNGITIDPETGEITWDAFSNDAAGTKVFLCMDQTETQVNNGQNKVVFERKNVCHPDSRSMVYVGCNSLITYVSPDKTGEASESGSAALAFDPSNPFHKGRLILFLRGAYDWEWQYSDAGPGSEQPDPFYYDILYKYPFNDAAVIVAGHYIPSFNDEAFVDPETLESSIEYNAPAGKTAKFNIIDNKFYNDADVVKPVANTDNSDQKRLLWVINDVQNHGTLASDPYWYYWMDEASEGFYWAWLNPENTYINVRHGFIIGNNGVMDVYDNTGLAYVAGALNQVDPIAAYEVEDLSFLKERNPSALIIDNIDEAVLYDGTVEYIASNPFERGENARHAQMLFRGNAVAYFMESAASRLPYLTGADTKEYRDVKFGYIYNFWARNEEDPFNDDPVGDMDLDYDQALAVGEKVDGLVVGAHYDGWQLEQNEMTQQYTALLPLEGIHVFDVEGKFSARSLANTTLYADPYATTPVVRDYAITGVVNGTMGMSSVVRDYKGQELQLPWSPAVNTVRPLCMCDTEYPRYNSPAMFLNANAQLFNTILRHDDATKFVDGVPSDSDPVYTGGEVYYFTNEQFAETEYVSSPDRFRMPELRFFNSTFELHESACVSGVRFVYRDIPGSTNVETGMNNSIIKFYDHGDVLDTLFKRFGRALQFSSTYATMADGSSNYATESAFVNVYKGNKPEYREAGATDYSSTVKLTLTRGNEFPAALVDARIPAPIDYSKQVAHHLFMLSQPEKMDAHCWMMIGWPRRTTTDTDSGWSFYPDYPTMPWPYADAGKIISGNPYPALPYDVRTISALPADEHLIFPLDVIHPNYPAAPATVFVDGGYPLYNGEGTPAEDGRFGTLITFGSWDVDGNAVPVPLISDDMDGIVYNNHGGKISMGKNGFDENDPSYRNNITPVLYVDTLITKMLWNDWDESGWDRVVQFSAICDIPADQVVFSGKYAVQPWGLTTEMMEARADQTNGKIRIDANQSRYVNNTNANKRYPRIDQSGVEEMLFGWYNREALPALSVAKGLPTPKRSVKTFNTSGVNQISNFLTRATESPDQPIDRPAYLLYVGAEDRITQMRVCGATMADPFHLDVVGDGYWPFAGRVDEFVSEKTEIDLYTEHFIGEGAHAVLFGEAGGTIGLGNRDWNEHSVNAWNLIGKEYVSIAPLGDMNVVLNSDLIVADNLPLIATNSFGATETNRVSFYSNVPREIRIPSGCFLDLSAFGQAQHRQEIEFAGQVRLVLEDGAGIRFPSRDKVTEEGGVVLYFNDDAQLVFEGLDIQGVYSSASMTDYDVIKLLGKGDIWLNKNAKMLINGDVHVGVESDNLTPNTSITLSIKRQAACYVGDANMSGGTFQVGNPVDRTGQTVRFTLEMDGADAMFQVNREGFFGLGAGLINKAGLINGDASILNNPVLVDGKAQIGESGYPVFTPSVDAWQVIPLYNVYRTSVEVKQGVFQHNNIADGSDSAAALMVYGPAQTHRLRLSGANQAIVRGGGNLMYVPALHDDVTYYQANIWDYAGMPQNGAVVTGEAYSILGSAGIILNEPAPANAIIEAWNGGRSVEFTSDGSVSYNAIAYAMFNYFGFYPYHLQQAKAVCLGANRFTPSIGFVNLDVQNEKYPTTMERIVRAGNPGNVNGDVRESLNVGYIDARNDGDEDPTAFGNVRS